MKQDKMEFRQIVSITGLPGLFQLVNTKNNGAFVRNLEDKKVRYVSARKHQVTPLESIEIFTIDENIPLQDVFKKMDAFKVEITEANKKNDKPAYKELFEKVLPNYDDKRVYASDIKKVFKWYPILAANDLLHFEEAEKEEGSSDPEQKKEDNEENKDKTEKDED